MTRSVFTDDYQLFVNLLTQKRKEAKLTQEGLATKLGKTQPYVAKYEKRVRRIDFIEFLDIADAIGFDPHEFVDKFYDN